MRARREIRKSRSSRRASSMRSTLRRVDEPRESLSVPPLDRDSHGDGDGGWVLVRTNHRSHTMKQATLGGLQVGRIGLGAMGMSAAYTGHGSDDAESIKTIHRAIDLGVTLIDTAEIYGPYTNEELVGRALEGRREQVVLATKFGFMSHT